MPEQIQRTRTSAIVDSSGLPYVLRDNDIPLPPVEATLDRTRLLVAPPPVIDRFPTVIGQKLSGQYLSAAFRLCNSGWRYQFVDLLNELIEHDPHARAVTRQRVLPTAGGRVSINPAKLPPGHKDEKLAAKIAEDFDEDFSNIPGRTQALGQLNWGVVYGLSASEIMWDFTENWTISGLSNIHSRRLNFPNPTDWELYIYDQGLVGPGFGFMGPTNGVYGLRVSSLPGKFIAHAPALNGDYPTRDGEGRYIATYMLLKRMVVRATAQDFERMIRPWVIGYFNRDNDSDGNPPMAGPEDIAALTAALNALGAGSMNSAALPNTVKVELLKAITNMSAEDFVSFLNREMSKGLLGQSFTTEPGANGNLATAQTAKVGTLEILRYDARALADTLERDLAWVWMQLRYPGVRRRLLPRIDVMVDELPDPEKVIDIAVKGSSIDMPIDVDELSAQTGLKLIGKDDKKGRRTRMVGPGKGPTPTDSDEAIAQGKAKPEEGDDAGKAAAKKKPTDDSED